VVLVDVSDVDVSVVVLDVGVEELVGVVDDVISEVVLLELVSLLVGVAVVESPVVELSRALVVSEVVSAMATQAGDGSAHRALQRRRYRRPHRAGSACATVRLQRERKSFSRSGTARS